MTQELTLIERAQQALRGEEPWEPIMGRIHAFVRGDLDAQIAALTERLRAVEAERDEWKRKYETQCAGSMSAHERRIHLEADLRAELERKDAALKAQQAVVDAARALDGFNTGDCYEVEIEDYETLTAALENLRSDNDGK